MLGFHVHHPFQGPLTHLCDLEAGYGGVWAPNFGGVAPGFEPRTSCLRVRSVSITLRGPPLNELLKFYFRSWKYKKSIIPPLLSRRSSHEALPQMVARHDSKLRKLQEAFYGYEVFFFSRKKNSKEFSPFFSL